MNIDLLLTVTSTADKLLKGTNIDNLKRPWNLKSVFFIDFVANLDCESYFIMHILTRIAEISQDNLRMKFSTDYKSLSFDLPG